MRRTAWNNAGFPVLLILQRCTNAAKVQPYKAASVAEDSVLFLFQSELYLNSQPSSKTNLFYTWTGVHLTQYLYRCFFSGDSIETSLIARTLYSRGCQGSQSQTGRRIKIFMSMWFLFSSIVSYCFLGVCLCVLQEELSFSALVQLFDPLLSPRCYAVVGLKSNGDRISSWWIYTYAHDYNLPVEGVMITHDHISIHASGVIVLIICMI